MIVRMSSDKVSHKKKIIVLSQVSLSSSNSSIKKSPSYTMAKSILKKTANPEIRKVNIRLLVVLYSS